MAQAALVGLAAALALLVGGSHQAALAAPAQASSSTHTETIHTTANHPWLTADHGWVPVGLLRPGEGIVTLDGATSTVAWVHVVPGQADMYNLTVANDHTYAVGDGQAVVHNTGPKVCTVTDRDLYRRGSSSSAKMDNVRDGKDIPESADMARNTDEVSIPREDGTVEIRVMGQSTFENLAPGKNIWRLPAGTNLADIGLRAVNDQGTHWAIQPLETESRPDYTAGLELLNELFQKTW